VTIILRAATDSVSLTTFGSAPIDVSASWIDMGPGSPLAPILPDGQNTPFTSATTQVIAPGPPVTTVARNVKTLTIVNKDPAVANPIAVTRTIKGVTTTMTPGLGGVFVLPAGYCLQWTDENDWRLLDQSGAEVVVSVGISPIAISASGSSVSIGTIAFSNSNGVSFGMDGSTVTASIAALAAINVSAGTTSQNLSNVVFSNSNGVSFGLDGSTITASVGPGAGSVFAFSQDADFVTHFPIVQAALSFQKLSLPMNISATQLAILAAISGSSGSSGALTVSHAVYTMSGTAASLVSSASRGLSWTSGAAATASSIYGGASGTRYRTLPVSYVMTPGDYLFAWGFSTANGEMVSVFGRAGLNVVGTFDGVEISQFLPGSSVSSAHALPNTLAATDTGYARTGFSALLQPGAILFGTH
jgi:hypothetical protein